MMEVVMWMMYGWCLTYAWGSWMDWDCMLGGWVWVSVRVSEWGGCGAWIPPKRGQKRVRKLCFRGRQVGAFSVFWQGDTGIPFIFWLFFVFFRKI